MLFQRGFASLSVLSLLSIALPESTHATEATVYLTCYSLNMQGAQAEYGGETLTLRFTNDQSDEVNNEWFLSGGTTEITSLLVLDFQGSQLSAPVALRIPSSGDENLNLLTDFYEVSRPVTAQQTTGEFQLDDGADVYPGTIKATWNRDANVATGTVKLQMSIPDFGILNVPFTHSFEILQFKGPLTYAVTSTNVNASVDLKREGADGSFKGPWPFYQYSRAELGWTDADWTGPGGLKFELLASDAIADTPFSLLRAGNSTSDLYLGAFFFADGDPTTAFPDEYDLWEIVVVDPNDSNGNNIPDLSDVPAGNPAGDPPLLAVRMDGGRLKLRITGKQGQVVTLEQRSAAGTGAWSPGQALTLTADTQEFDLGTPAASTFFIRGRL